MKYTYTPQGTCSRLIEIEINDGKVASINVTGGCHGNLQGVCALARGRDASDVITTLSGIRCGNKPTSCPDQIAKAVALAVEAEAAR